MMRLDKYLTACNVGTRSEVKKYIKQNQVLVNGSATGLKPETKIDENADIVTFLGKTLVYEAYSYYLLYKRAGFVTAVTDDLHRTVMDEFPANIRSGLSPVGRLDLDTEGVLIITNDGAFTHHVLSPSHHVPKTYVADLDKPLPADAVQKFAQGIDIGDDDLCLPAELTVLESFVHTNGMTRHRAQVTLHEGRYHQVKRMFSALGCKVLYLKRISIGTLNLDGLLPGEYRRLTDEEIALLKES